MTAREMIEQEYKGDFSGDLRSDAAERVIERQNSEMERIKAENAFSRAAFDSYVKMCWDDNWRDLRDRLDRMVAAITTGYWASPATLPRYEVPELVAFAAERLAAIDAHIFAKREQEKK